MGPRPRCKAPVGHKALKGLAGPIRPVKAGATRPKVKDLLGPVFVEKSINCLKLVQKFQIIKITEILKIPHKITLFA